MVNITHIKASTLAPQTARPQGTQRTLVRQLGQRVGLIHKLRKLTTTEELTSGSDHWANVNQRHRCHLFRITNRHTLAHDTLHAQQSHSYLILDQLTDCLDPPVTQVVDIIRLINAIVDHYHVGYDFHQILFSKSTLINGHIKFQAAVQLVASYSAQIIATW